MPGNITNYSVGSTTPVAIVATVVGATIQIGEVNLGSTASYTVYHSTPSATGGAAVPTATGRLVAAGGLYTMSKTLSQSQPFSPGEIVLFVKATTGTLTLQADELGC
jgi:hypothetical protein